MMELAARKDVPVEETWDLSLIYATEEEFLEDAKRAEALSQEIAERFQGKLETAGEVEACLNQYRKLYEILALVANYADLAVSVDYYNAANQERNDRISSLWSRIMSRLSFVEGEISELPDEVLQEALAGEAKNRGMLKEILRNKPYRLQPEAERVLAALSQTLDAPYQFYNMSKLADMQFASFEVNGETYPLGYSLFEDDYEYDSRTEVRRAAFRAFSDKIRQYENATALAYNTQVQKEKTLAELKGFPSVFDSLLFPQKVSRELYDRQIDLITTKLAPHMRKYAKLLQKVHHLDQMTFADLKLPVDPEYDPKVTIEESRNYVEKGLAILGEDYVSMIQEGYEKRWVDFAKNKGKSTGGFCASPYGRGSFILLSWNNRMADVFTLAHEFGHAGHFRACSREQSIFDTDISSYFVESPSTMNELLMANYLLKTNEDKRFRRWVLSCMISNTYYHNFVTHLLEAAYQRKVYRIVDEGGSVQAEALSGLMKETLSEFWGDAVELIPGAELTWMRQPHYYMGLYSYTYSAGLTIATQVSKRIEREGQPAVEDWKRVLAAGGTKTPEELARMAGVDISTDAPLLDTIEMIGDMIDEICRLTEELEQ